jgi:Ca-activated chloride channel family protein
MTFAHPTWLLAGALACAALVWQFRRYGRNQSAALAQFASARLLPGLTSSVSPARRRAKRALFVAGVAFLFAALARPQAGFVWQETHRKGLELLFAIDTSKSMLAQDVKPDRLTRAKLAVTDLVGRLEGDGVGLIAFSGNAFLQCPVTLDYDAFGESLSALDVGIIPRGGTDIAAAIREAGAVFKTRSTSEKILVLITDGEDLGGEGIAAAQAAAGDGVKIFTVGVGGSVGELVPIPTANGGTDFARDASGEFVRSQLDESTLQEIAAAAGGIYQPLGIQGEGLAAIYDEGLAPFTREELSARQNKVPLEQLHWALAAALACFLAEHLIGNRRRKPGASRAALAVPATVALALLALFPQVRAAAPQDAEQAYHQGDFARSQQEYAAAVLEEPDNAQLRFNTGAAAYKAGDFAAAADAFAQTIATGDVPVQQGAYYNLGNTQFRLGQATETENPEETIKTWEDAVKSYDAALEITPNDTAAKTNRALVQRKIDELKKQQEQEQEQEQSGSENKPDDQQGDAQKDQGDESDKGGSEKPQDPEQSDKPDGSDSAEKPKDSEQSENPDGSDSAEKPQDSEQSDKPDGSDPAEKPGDQGEQEKPEHSDEQSEPDKDGAEKPAQPDPVNPGEKPESGDIEPANGTPENEPGEQAGAAPGERREPGQMTVEEAQQLLDALKGEERQVPAISAQGRAGAQPQQTRTLKDW